MLKPLHEIYKASFDKIVEQLEVLASMTLKGNVGGLIASLGFTGSVFGQSGKTEPIQLVILLVFGFGAFVHLFGRFVMLSFHNNACKNILKEIRDDDDLVRTESIH